MHDTIDERLAELGGILEDAAEVGSPTAVRFRGEQIRAARRRRMAAAGAVSAAVMVLGAGGFVALRSGGGNQTAPVHPDTSGPTSASSMVTTNAATNTATNNAANTATAPTPAAKPIAVVDLKQDVMRVYDKSGKVIMTIPVTGGRPGHESRTGTFTITARQDKLRLQSTTTSTNADTYDALVQWAITLDGGPLLYGTTWDGYALGQQNVTSGDISLSTNSALWLYSNVAIGDRVQIQ